jgi:hypothetical protein
MYQQGEVSRHINHLYIISRPCVKPDARQLFPGLIGIAEFVQNIFTDIIPWVGVHH